MPKFSKQHGPLIQNKFHSIELKLITSIAIILIKKKKLTHTA